MPLTVENNIRQMTTTTTLTGQYPFHDIFHNRIAKWLSYVLDSLSNSIFEVLNQPWAVGVMVNGKYIKSINCAIGIRQGGSLSLELFNLIMDKIISEVRQLSGYKMNNEPFSIICYADDAVLVADCEDNLQRLFHRFVITCKKYLQYGSFN